MSATDNKIDDFKGRHKANNEMNKELRTLDILLTSKVGRSAGTLVEYIEFRIAQGSTLDVIKQDLLKDLEEGGRIFGEFRNAMKVTFKGSTNRFADGGFNIVLGTEDKRMWMAVMINTCESPDGDDEDMAFCMSRHGKIKSYAEWESDFGVPKAGGTVCGQYCHCVLLPANVAQLEPIYRSN